MPCPTPGRGRCASEALVSACSITSGSWVAQTTAAPVSRASRASRIATAIAFAPSRREVGSSARSSAGREAIARAIATRARSPWERRATRWVEPLGEPDRLERRARPPFGSVRAAERERELDVLERREVRDEPGLLAHVGDRGAPQRRPAGPVEGGELTPVDLDLAGVRQLEPGQQVEEGRLSGARRSGERVQPAAAELEVERLETRWSRRSGARARVVERRRDPRGVGHGNGAGTSCDGALAARLDDDRPFLELRRRPARRSRRAAAAPPAAAASRRGRRRSCRSSPRRASTPPTRVRRGSARSGRRCGPTRGRG